MAKPRNTHEEIKGISEVNSSMILETLQAAIEMLKEYEVALLGDLDGAGRYTPGSVSETIGDIDDIKHVLTNDGFVLQTLADAGKPNAPLTQCFVVPNVKDKASKALCMIGEMLYDDELDDIDRRAIVSYFQAQYMERES